MNNFNIPQQLSQMNNMNNSINGHRYQYQLNSNLMNNLNGTNQYNHDSIKRSRTSRAKRPGLILHEMTPQQKNDLKKRYVIWTQQAIKQLQVKIHKRSLILCIYQCIKCI